MRHPKALQVISSTSLLIRPADVLAFTLSFFLTAVVFALLLLNSSHAFADSHARVARLSHVDGSVQILNGNQTEFEQAVANMPLLEGSRVQTGNNGRAEVQFDNGSIARLTPNSSMSLNQIQRGLEGAENTQVEILSGMGYFQLRSRGGEDSLLFGANAITPIEGPATIRMNMDTTPAELSVLDGKVHVAGGTQFAVDVQTNETIRFDAADTARYYLAQGVTSDSWDQWNGERDQLLTQQALKRTDVAANSSGAGWGDLDQNGNWYSVPGYGNVWSPSGVGMGWDPYGSGYWGYYPGSGYSWISANSWGWLPYRCGGWNYFDSFGWGWMPTNCGYGYGGGGYYPGGTVIVNGPPGYRPPPRPRPAEVIAVNGSNTPNRIVKVDRPLQPIRPGVQSPATVVAGRPIVVNGTLIRPIQPRPQEGTAFRPSAPLQPVPPGQQMIYPGGVNVRPPYNGPATATHPGMIPRIASPANQGQMPQQPNRPVQAATPMAPSVPRMSAPPQQPHYSAPPQQPHYSAPTSQPNYSAPPSQPHYSAPTSQPSYSAPSAAPAQSVGTRSK